MRRKGFTLIELLIVIAIIGVLVAIAITKFARLATDRNLRACQANLKSLDSALNIYYVEKGVKGDLAELKDAGYLVQVPVCPIGSTYVLPDSLYASCPDTTHTLPHG